MMNKFVQFVFEIATKLYNKLFVYKTVCELESNRRFVRNDDFLKVVKGYKDVQQRINEMSYCSQEVEKLSQYTFGLRDDDFLIMYDKDSKIEDAMNEHFIGGKFTSQNPYPQHSLRSFLNDIVYSLLTIGEVFYELEWESTELNGRKYVLPVNFYSIPPEIMLVRRKNDKVTKFIKRYSWFTYLFNRYKHINLPRKTELVPEEIFHLQYFDKQTPVQKSLPYLGEADRFSKLLLKLSIAKAYPENKSLTVSLARSKSIKKEKLKSDLNRALIAKQFNSFIGGGELGNSNSDSFKITEYYDIFLVVRSLQYRDKLRASILKSFNDQILQRVAEKNELSFKPKLVYIGSICNDELYEKFEKYKNGCVSYDDMLNILKAKNL